MYEMSPSSAGSHVLEAQGSPSSPVPDRARAQGTGMPFRVRVPWHQSPRRALQTEPLQLEGRRLRGAKSRVWLPAQEDLCLGTRWH